MALFSIKEARAFLLATEKQRAKKAEPMSKDTVSSKGSRLRCVWKVVGGIIPEQPLAEYTRRWLLTSETYYAEYEQQSIATFERFKNEAHDYARDLENPGLLNWVSIEWIYL